MKEKEIDILGIVKSRKRRISYVYLCEITVPIKIKLWEKFLALREELEAWITFEVRELPEYISAGIYIRTCNFWHFQYTDSIFFSQKRDEENMMMRYPESVFFIKENFINNVNKLLLNMDVLSILEREKSLKERDDCIQKISSDTKKGKIIGKYKKIKLRSEEKRNESLIRRFKKRI